MKILTVKTEKFKYGYGYGFYHDGVVLRSVLRPDGGLFQNGDSRGGDPGGAYVGSDYPCPGIDRIFVTYVGDGGHYSDYLLEETR